MRGYPECREINLWTYWQGRGVYSPRILLIGQDWGCPVNGLDGILATMDAQALNPKEDQNCLYFQGRNKPFRTDYNLKELFRSIGTSDRKYEDITKYRYEDLFFTNLCLGYRSEGSSGDFLRFWMTNSDVERKVYPELIELLDPKVIICLGRETYECFLELMTGKKINASVEEKTKQIGGFNAFVEKDRENPRGRIGNIPVFAFAHTGAMGVLNRNAVYDGNGKRTTSSSLQKMKEDWSYVGRML